MGKKSKQRKLEYGNKRKAKNDDDSDDSDNEKDTNEEKKRKSSKRNDMLNTQFNIRGGTLAAPTFDNLPVFTKRFWIGPSDISETDGNGGPSNALKELRKGLGINVKGNTDGCPPPVTYLSSQVLPGNEVYSDNWLPVSFFKIFQMLNLKKPSPVQMQSWPAALYGSNILCISPTGSGKTLAYALPALPHISKQGTLRRKGPVGLVLVPTRELAIQVCGDMKPLQKLYSVKSLAIYGGQEKSQQLDGIDGIGGCPSIVVATPGRLLDLVARKEVSLDFVTYLVLDEADRMLALGFAEQLDAITSQIRPDRQALMFTATFPGKLRDACITWLGDDYVSIRCGTLDIEQTVTQHVVASSMNDGMKVDPKLYDVKDSEPNRPDLDKTDRKKAGLTKSDLKEPNTIDEAVSEEASQTIPTLTGASTHSLALTVNKSIVQKVHVCAEHKKPRLLIHYMDRVREEEKSSNIRQPGPMLVFCTKIKTVKFVYEFLVKQAGINAAKKKNKQSGGGQAMSGKNDAGSGKYRDQPSHGEKLGVGLLHGQMSQQDREKTMQLFKAVSQCSTTRMATVYAY
jgi:superfamily II DNA/RNA helicase